MKIPRCDLFWSPHYNIPLLPIQARKKIVTIHDACHLAFPKMLTLPERLYAKFVMSRAFHRSDAVITDSSFSKDELTRLLGKPRSNLLVIPAAVDTTRFKREVREEKLKDLRTKYNLPSRFVLFVGSYKAHKNLHGLLQAFEKVTLSDLALVIAGKDKGLRNSVQRIERDRVFWLGEVHDDDLPSLYTLAEMFAFPSFYEGFGFPPLEAMSCGCPTIVSNKASLPEVCGESSLYINPQNPEELSSAIYRIATTPSLKSSLIEKGHERAASFSWERAAQSYRDLFVKISNGQSLK